MKKEVRGSSPTGAYSPGIIAKGEFVFVSGQGPIVDGEIVHGGIAEQTRITMENLGVVLAQAGAGYSDVVSCNVFLQNIGDFATMDEVYQGFFSEPYPSRTTVGADLDRILVEINCIAVLPDH